MDYNVWRRKVQATYRGSAPEVNMKTFKQRERRLKDEGFRVWEITHLALHTITSEGVRATRAGRKRLIRQLHEEWQEITDSEVNEAVVQRYMENGWRFNNGKPSPYKMLESYKRRTNAQDTPQLKNRKKKLNYAEYKDNSL